MLQGTGEVLDSRLAHLILWALQRLLLNSVGIVGQVGGKGEGRRRWEQVNSSPQNGDFCSMACAGLGGCPGKAQSRVLLWLS